MSLLQVNRQLNDEVRALLLRKHKFVLVSAFNVTMDTYVQLFRLWYDKTDVVQLPCWKTPRFKGFDAKIAIDCPRIADDSGETASARQACCTIILIDAAIERFIPNLAKEEKVLDGKGRVTLRDHHFTIGTSEDAESKTGTTTRSLIQHYWSDFKHVAYKEDFFDEWQANHTRKDSQGFED